MIQSHCGLKSSVSKVETKSDQSVQSAKADNKPTEPKEKPNPEKSFLNKATLHQIEIETMTRKSYFW